jgi:chromosome segregation ATPase
LEGQLQQERQRVVGLERGCELTGRLSDENEILRGKLVKLRERYERLKQNRSTSMEELCDLKLTAARLEGELENAERLIVVLKNERDEVRAKLISAEGFLDQCCSRMSRAEQESEQIRKQMHALNTNQNEMVAVQAENERLRTRLDHLETDLEAYTERQRRNVIRPRRLRL